MDAPLTKTYKHNSNTKMSDKEMTIVYDEGQDPNRAPLVEQINAVLNRELKSPETVRALLATTFKGLEVVTMKQALMEGMIRGFQFKDFLQKDIYAIPFKNGYSLITSIDHARKRGMRSGIVGKSAPEFGMKADGKGVDWCSVTVKRLVDGFVGDFTATVYFDEYTKGRDLWVQKPRTMIAKVAEMHALRMACPEELSHVYVEEELEQETRYQKAKVETESIKMGSLLKHEENIAKETETGADETQNATEDSPK